MTPSEGGNSTFLFPDEPAEAPERFDHVQGHRVGTKWGQNSDVSILAAELSPALNWNQRVGTCEEEDLEDVVFFL